MILKQSVAIALQAFNTCGRCPSRRRIYCALRYEAALHSSRPGCSPLGPPERALLLRFEQTGLEGKAHELGAVIEAQFLHDARAVGIHRLG